MNSIRNLFGNRSSMMTSEKPSLQNENDDEDVGTRKTTTNFGGYNRNRTISETSNCSMNSESITDVAAEHRNTKGTKHGANTTNKDSESYFWIMWRS